MAVRAAAGMFGEMKVTGGAKGGKGGGKARKYDLGSTNIAGLGTDLEKAVRQAASEGEPAWTNAGKKVGLQVWRIEKFKVVEWPKKKYGTFYSGDSYIVLHTYHKKGKGAMAWDVHFWIGKDSSQDEYGTAAYKTVELDDFLGGVPTQYREVQDSESRAFLKLFKRFMTMEGGVDSGFNKVLEKTYRPRLLQCKGRMNVLVKEVPLSYKSLNQGDSFIYDGGMKIFVWHGKQARPMEKAKAMNMAQALDDERGGKPEREVFEDGDNNPTQKEWWHAIGGKGDIKSAAEGGSDEAVNVAGSKRLMALSDQSGRLKLSEIATGDQIRRDLLVSQDVFILDDGYEVMVWVGLEASRAERKAGLDKAVEYLKQYQKPLTTPISRFMEGGENDQFEAAFEVGVMSMARPGGGAKFGTGGGLSGLSRTKAVAASGRADYAGNGGQGTATDFDALYAAQGADPDDWQGRQGTTSAYARELQDGKHGAYDPKSGWVSSMTDEQRATRDARVDTLEQDHASGKYAKAGSGGAAAGVSGVTAVVQHPTIVANEGFDPAKDAQVLRKAMKGVGTTNNKLIEILAYRTTEQRQHIRASFSELFERDLLRDIVNDTSGNFERALKCLIRTKAERDANFVYKSMKGGGTDDLLLIDIICSQQTADIDAIKSEYGKVAVDHILDEDIKGDTSFNFRKLLCTLVNERRQSSSTVVDEEQCIADAKALYKGGEGRIGTNEKVFIDIFAKRSYPHLLKVFEEYSKICKHSIRVSVKREFSGSIKRALQLIIDNVRNPTALWVEQLYGSMHGLGTDDRRLIWILVHRSELDLGEIKVQFEEKYGKTLEHWIKSETSFHYQKLLLAICDNTSNQ